MDENQTCVIVIITSIEKHWCVLRACKNLMPWYVCSDHNDKKKKITLLWETRSNHEIVGMGA